MIIVHCTILHLQLKKQIDKNFLFIVLPSWQKIELFKMRLYKITQFLKLALLKRLRTGNDKGILMSKFVRFAISSCSVRNNYQYLLQCKTVSHSKKPTNRREKEEKSDQKSNNGIKDNLEAKPDGPGDNISEDEAQTNNQRKKGQSGHYV